MEKHLDLMKASYSTLQKVEVLGSTLGLDDGVTLGLDNIITLGLDDGSDMGSSDRSFDGSNDGKPVVSLLGVSVG